MEIKPCKNKSCYWFFEDADHQYNCVLSNDMTSDCLLNGFEHFLIQFKKIMRLRN